MGLRLLVGILKWEKTRQLLNDVARVVGDSGAHSGGSGGLKWND